MKKKIVALCLVLALALTAIGGATLAYFTDFETKTNTFTVGDVDIQLNELGKKDGETVAWENADKVLVPGAKDKNNVSKVVTVKNIGESDAYMWIEVWVPSALDDGDDNSPAAPGKGNSLHFNYGQDVTETKFSFLKTKEINGVSYNGYVHFVKDSDPIAKGGSTPALLDQVYMDKNCSQCTFVPAEGEEPHAGNCMVLMNGQTHYTGNWDLVINAVGFQADGFTIESAIAEYYGKPLEIWP